MDGYIFYFIINKWQRPALRARAGGTKNVTEKENKPHTDTHTHINPQRK